MWVCGELENIIIFLSEVYIGCTNLVMVYNVFVFNETTIYVRLSTVEILKTLQVYSAL